MNSGCQDSLMIRKCPLFGYTFTIENINPEREGGNSEVEPLVVKKDLNMKLWLIFRINVFLFFIYF